MSEAANDDLKPCPFCGGDASTEEQTDGWGAGCRDDFCHGYICDGPHYVNAGFAIAAWNRRA
jgi:hypothetical protein